MSKATPFDREQSEIAASNHTPTPWHWEPLATRPDWMPDGEPFDHMGEITGVAPDDDPRSFPLVASCVDRDNGRRIVACVDACEGINPEAVPDLLEVAQRLAAWESDPDRYGGDLADLAHKARAAIAKAEGGAS